MNTTRGGRRRSDERGATLALVAVSIVVLLAVAALAIDLAAAFAWRAEAQKISDSASLAGASAFLDERIPANAEPLARERAYEYALLHTIKKEAVDSSEVTIQVIPDSQRVRVWVERDELPTWFARILGVPSIDVGAVAAAEAVSAGEATCLKPVALPDLWDEVGNDDDGDNVWDEDEAWEYDPDTGDRYQRWDGADDPDGSSATGYGSDWRVDVPQDYGRMIELKPQDPQSNRTWAPGLFLPWALPPSDGQGTCDKGGGGGNPRGGATYRNNWCECNTTPVELFNPIYDTEPGNMVGPTRQGVDELVGDDPDVYWEPRANGGAGGPARPDGQGGFIDVGTSTPRVIKVALMNPGEWDKGGRQSFEFNNFALLFLEGIVGSGNQAPVMARFMYYATGSGTGPTQGSLVKFIRLVQ